MNCVIIEDEKAAQELLISYVDKTPFLTCLGCYESVLEITSDQLQQTDLLFLDIQLPEINGLNFLNSLRNPPRVIITTAYAHYALDAFEAQVVDYLLKPFSFERYFKAVSHFRELYLPQEKNDALFISFNKALHKISKSSILWVQAEVDYVKIVTEEKEWLILGTIKNWEKQLTGDAFMRVHRSYLVNFKKIDVFLGNILMVKKKEIPVGRTYKNALIARINAYENKHLK